MELCVDTAVRWGLPWDPMFAFARRGGIADGYVQELKRRRVCWYASIIQGEAASCGGG